MRLIIAGSRNAREDLSRDFIRQFLEDEENEVRVVISGDARGPDTWGREEAERLGIPVIRMPADWDRYGKSAGYRRNEEMAREGDFLLALWDGKSRGTMHMIDIMGRAGKGYVARMV